MKKLLIVFLASLLFSTIAFSFLSPQSSGTTQTQDSGIGGGSTTMTFVWYFHPTDVSTRQTLIEFAEGSIGDFEPQTIELDNQRIEFRSTAFCPLGSCEAYEASVPQTTANEDYVVCAIWDAPAMDSDALKVVWVNDTNKTITLDSIPDGAGQLTNDTNIFIGADQGGADPFTGTIGAVAIFYRDIGGEHCEAIARSRTIWAIQQYLDPSTDQFWVMDEMNSGDTTETFFLNYGVGEDLNASQEMGADNNYLTYGG